MCTNGNFVQGYCPGPSNIQCCIVAAKSGTGGKSAVAVLSQASNGLQGVLVNPEKLCGSVAWKVLDTSTNKPVKTGSGTSFIINPGPGNYQAAFYCSPNISNIDSKQFLWYGLFETAHQEFVSDQKTFYKDRMEFYHEYLEKLAQV